MKRLRIEELEVGRLRVDDLEVTRRAGDEAAPPGGCATCPQRASRSEPGQARSRRRRRRCGSFRASAWPPCAWAIASTIASPRPTPPSALAASARRNRSNA